jgi:hypothetical protein
MKGVTALTKIRLRTKQLQKKHPGKKYRTLQKQAASEYKSGKIPKARKKSAHKKTAPKKHARRKVGAKYKVYHEVKRIGRVKRKRSTAKRRKAPRATKTRTRTVRKTVYKTRRVGGMGKSIMPIVAIAGLGLVAYLLLKPKASTNVPPLVTTGNTTRDQSASNLVAYATAAGLSISAIAQLINALNSSSDSTVVQAAASPEQGINTLLALPTGGPSINLG